MWEAKQKGIAVI